MKSTPRIEDELDCRDYSRILMESLVNLDFSFSEFSGYLFKSFFKAKREPSSESKLQFLWSLNFFTSHFCCINPLIVLLAYFKGQKWKRRPWAKDRDQGRRSEGRKKTKTYKNVLLAQWHCMIYIMTKLPLSFTFLRNILCFNHITFKFQLSPIVRPYK